MFKKFSGSILYLVITLLVLSLYWDRHQSLEKFELAIQDSMFKMRGHREVPGDIAIVGIDDRTLETVGKWPWNRDKLAGLIDAISAQGPKTIALKMTLSPNNYQRSAGFNDSLSKALRRAGNVIIGYYYSRGDIAQGVLLPDALVNNTYKTIDNPSNFAKYPPLSASRIFPPDSTLANAASRMGFVNVNIDEDRKIRCQPLIIGYRGEFFPSIHAAAAASYKGTDRSRLGVTVGSAITFGATSVPTDQHGQMCVNFYGPENTFRHYSASEVIQKRIGLHDLTGKLVLVGFTANGSTDIYSTPVASRLSGLELDANVIGNMLQGNAIKNLTGRAESGILLLLAIGVFAALVLPRISLLWRIVALAGMLIALVAVNYILFTSFNIITMTFYPAIEIAFFLAASPMMKTKDELRSDEGQIDDDDEDEVDYETLLSSTGSIKVSENSTPRPTTSFQYPRPAAQATPIPVASATSAETIYASSEAPVKKSSPSEGTVAVMEAPSIDHFGRYRILRPIGKGAMGMVYQGLDPAIDRPVALKTIRLDQVADTDEIGELRERLDREAKAAGKLSHPNIVTIYDVGEEGVTQYIAMEFLQGQTLENILKAGHDWDYRTISRVMIQACEALDYAHENGIVHRDIKPANIMILTGNKVKVMDFGIARLDKSANMTQTGTALGTPNYISPEQLKGLPVDRRSDIFSLGVVFYEVLTREKPFKGDTISALIYSILHTEPARPSEINMDIPRIFDKIIAKALVKDPDLRFQRAKDVSDILRKLI